MTPPIRARVRPACVLLVLVACSTGSPSPPHSSPLPVLPAGALPGARATTAPLDPEALAADALAPDDLLTLIGDAGFTEGVERSFGGAAGPLERVVARSLAFMDDEGAGVYLSWLRDHATELIGNVQPLPAQGMPPGAVFVRHLPDGCCPKEVPVYFAAWQRGAVVLSLRASGRRARAEPVARLAALFDEEA